MSKVNDIPKVSLGMPVYNGENYLAEALSSILAQTFQDFELIISDNASTDRTKEICRDFSSSDTRIRYMRQKVNKGATWNFNHVFEMSRGKFFKWVAHDDMIATNFLARCVDILEQDSNCILVFPRTILIDQNGHHNLCYLDTMASSSENAADRFRRYMIPGGGEPNPIFGLMRREVARDAGPFGDYGAADLVFLGRIALSGQSRLVKEPLFLRRIHPDISVRTHPDHLSREEFHTGAKARGLRFAMLRQLREFVSSVNRAELTREERLECYRVLLEWAWIRRTKFLKELALPVYANGRPTALGRYLHHLIYPNRKLRSEE